MADAHAAHAFHHEPHRHRADQQERQRDQRRRWTQDRPHQHKLDTMVLDKTGTITKGAPALTDVVAIGGFTEDEVLRLVASVERASEHPLGAAIVTGARERGLDLQEPAEFDSVTGQGQSSSKLHRPIR